MFGLLDRLGATLAAVAGLIVGAAVTFAALQLYDAWIDDPAVARAAREGFVAASEKLALQGQIEEMRRQFKVAEAAAAGDRARAEAANREADDAWKRYEAAVAADGGDDGCRVTDGDLDWLRHARPAPRDGLP